MNKPINATVGQVNAAEVQYNKRIAQIEAQIATLQAHLAEHRAIERKNWTHTGDLAYIGEKLGDILEFTEYFHKG